MNKLIGITGGMSSGKTTLCKKLIELNPDYIYIDVDDFRRSLYKNNEYIQELKSKIIELKQYKEIDSLILNKHIYYDKENMNKYKENKLQEKSVEAEPEKENDDRNEHNVGNLNNNEEYFQKTNDILNQIKDYLDNEKKDLD